MRRLFPELFQGLLISPRRGLWQAAIQSLPSRQSTLSTLDDAIFQVPGCPWR